MARSVLKLSSVHVVAMFVIGQKTILTTTVISHGESKFNWNFFLRIGFAYKQFTSLVHILLNISELSLFTPDCFIWLRCSPKSGRCHTGHPLTNSIASRLTNFLLCVVFNRWLRIDLPTSHQKVLIESCLTNHGTPTLLLNEGRLWQICYSVTYIIAYLLLSTSYIWVYFPLSGLLLSLRKSINRCPSSR